jgi:hypothetical protein
VNGDVAKKPVRFVIWVWGRGIDDFVRYCLPSILQPNNIPWLVREGYPVALDFYTVEADDARVNALAQDVHAVLSPLASDAAPVIATVSVAPGDGPAYSIKSAFFQLLVRRSIETQSHGIFVFADMYFGDGSIRNIVTYAQKPNVTVSGLYLRVKRDRFSELLERHHAVTGSARISNARLADICLDSLIDSMEASFADVDANASYQTSGSLRRVDADLYTYTFHAPTPILFSFQESDMKFFARFAWNFHLLDHVWPAMLIAQNRWRVMASSDLFLLAELNAEELETGVHAYERRPGMLYNDDYEQEHLHGRIHQTILMALRREGLPESG